MNKTELMETYTAEQLAEMVVEFQSGKERKVFKVSDNKNYQKEIDEFFKDSVDKICKDILEQKNNAMAMEFVRVICGLSRENGVYVHCTETKFSEKITHNSIEEKYGIKFDSVNFSEHDKGFTDKIKELQSEVEKYRKAFEDAKNELKDLEIKIEEEYKTLEIEVDRIRKNERELSEENAELHCKLQAVNAFQKGYPTEPIKVADMLINAEGEYEHSTITKVLCGEDKGTYRIFDIGELRQIAEHLLVYCNHNGEAEE